MIIKSIFEYSHSKTKQTREASTTNHIYTNLLEAVSDNVNNLLKQRTFILEK